MAEQRTPAATDPALTAGYWAGGEAEVARRLADLWPVVRTGEGYMDMVRRLGHSDEQADLLSGVGDR